MKVWNSACDTIVTSGERRGAMMGVLSCTHPDVEEFIKCKEEADELTNFNISVLATDKFIDAVQTDRPWTLAFQGGYERTLPARALWKTIMQSAYNSGEPGVIFIDRMNNFNNLHYCEEIVATNPCGEVPLPPYGACLLGSINLTSLVRNPFGPSARLDEEQLAAYVHHAVRFLDLAIDLSNFPLPENREEAISKRRIGLGITGLADALMMCNIVYGSAPSLDMVRRWMECIRNASYEASAALAVEKGPFPKYLRSPFLDGRNVAHLPANIRDQIGKGGIRNGVLNSIAPAGTISVLANNLSSGIEPVFKAEFTRRIRESSGYFATNLVVDFAVQLYRKTTGKNDALPPAFIDAESVTPREHVAVQALVQSYTDGAVSKTINVSSDVSFKDFESIYLTAFNEGCKGCTTFRPNAVRESILDEATARISDISSNNSQECLDLLGCSSCE